MRCRYGGGHISHTNDPVHAFPKKDNKPLSFELFRIRSVCSAGRNDFSMDILLNGQLYKRGGRLRRGARAFVF